MAQRALIAAKNAQAPILSPTLYHRAEMLYLKARSSYRRKYFNKAKQYAQLSRENAEVAEMNAIKKKFLDEDKKGK